jgi:hypothetical protein
MTTLDGLRRVVVADREFRRWRRDRGLYMRDHRSKGAIRRAIRRELRADVRLMNEADLRDEIRDIVRAHLRRGWRLARLLEV